MEIIQVAINGLSNGLVIALLALAFAAVYLPTGVFHLALGGLYILSPLILSSLCTHGIPWYIGALITLVVCTLLSVTCESLNHRRLFRQRASASAHLLSSLAIYIIITQAASIVWGDQTRVLLSTIDPAWHYSSVTITRTQLISVLCSMALAGAYYIILLSGGLGLRLRAMAANPTQAALRGINVPWLRVASFAFAGTFAASAGTLAALEPIPEPA